MTVNMNKKIILIILSALLVVLSGCSIIEIPDEESDPPKTDEAPYIYVSVEETPGLTVTSQNPVRIRSGENAVFSVDVVKGYILDLDENMTLSDNGILTVFSLLYPSTIQLNCLLDVSNNPSTITLDTNQNSAFVHSGTPVNLIATQYENTVFMGFSKGKPLSVGGTFLSGNPTYTYVADDDHTIYANYCLVNPKTNANPDKIQRLIYHANGGKAFGHLDKFYFDYEDDYYYFPNSLPDLGYFTRDGYVLAGYNTKSDGSGEFVGCGWNVMTDKNSTGELYANWLPVSNPIDFVFENDPDGEGVWVKKYNGTDETVVIPEFYLGQPVVGIKQNAFNGITGNTLMITRNIKTVENLAVNNCQNLERLIFSDGVLSISDNFYTECPNFSTLTMNAVLMPRYTNNREGTYAIKYEHMRASADKKKILVVAGSNCSYGLDSTILYAGLEHEYDIINYGCNAYSPSLFYLEACLKYMKSDDILLLIPEDNDFQYGRGEIRPYIWRFFEAAYEAFSEVDLRNYVNTFNSFVDVNNARMNMSPRTYQEKTTQTTNKFGDYIMEKKGHTSSFDPFTVGGTVNFKPANVTRYMNELNAALDTYHDQGVYVWQSFSVVNRNYLYDSSLPDGSNYRAYIDAVKDNIHSTIISDMADYIMEPQYFYNSHYHLNSEGTTIRSNMLLRDIKTQLEKMKADN